MPIRNKFRGVNNSSSFANRTAARSSKQLRQAVVGMDMFEPLERRQLLSTVPVVPAGWQAQPGLPPNLKMNAGSATPLTNVFTPAAMRGGYNLGQYGSTNVVFGTSQADGSGQTIAIVDQYDDPNAASDLNLFSTQYGLPTFNQPGGPTFKKVDENGGNSLPVTDPAGAGAKAGTWELEESLDIDWAHVMAPKANIILVECDNGTLYTGDQTAGTLAGVTVVSNSWGGDEFSGETGDDAIFNVPGKTFVFSTGDDGAFAKNKTTLDPHYPATSPNVLSVGGTNLQDFSDNTYDSETAWGDGINSGTDGGGGGGISTMESQPSYQNGKVNGLSTTNRTYPDVSINGGINASIVDSFDFGSTTPWSGIAGTSLSCPMWAGLIAVADQGRVAAGLTALTGPTQTLPMIYNLPSSDFHDITSGSNGYNATAGYDLATGIGSPFANNVVADLTGTSADLSVNVSAPTSTIAGSFAGYTYNVTVTNMGTSADPGGFTVTDTLPAGVVLQGAGTSPGNTGSGQTVIFSDSSSLGVGDSVGYTIHVTVPASTPDGTPLNDSATVATNGGIADPNSNNNQKSFGSSVVANADLSITNSGPAMATAGDPTGFTYTIVVTNNGPSDNVGGFVISDSLPSGETFQSTGSSAGASAVGQNVTISHASGLANGAFLTFTIHVTVASSVTYGTILADTAKVTSLGTTDPTPGNNTSNVVDTTVITIADLSVIKTSLPAAVEGQNLTYTVVVSNAGPSDAVGASVTDMVPSALTGVTFTATSTGGATGYTHSGTGNLSDTDNIPAGATVTYAITGTINPTATGMIINTASAAVAPPEIDPNSANNSSNWSTNIVPAALEPDPFGPGTALFVGNGFGGKYITVTNLPAVQMIQVTIGTTPRTFDFNQSFSTVGLERIVLYAAGGHDFVQLSKSVIYPAMVFASGGHNSVISSGSGNDVLVASGGSSTVEAGSGTSIVIGGVAGGDTLNGYGAGTPTTSSQDLFIAGGTQYDTNLAALFAISSEWNSGASLSTRASHLQFGGGLNGPYLLNASTVTHAAVRDSVAMMSATNMVYARTTGPGVYSVIVALHPPLIVQI